MSSDSLMLRLKDLTRWIEGETRQRIRDNPGFRESTTLTLTSACAYGLKQAIDDESRSSISWDNSDFAIPWGIELSRQIWPKPIVEPGPGLQGFQHASAVWELLPSVMDGICLLSDLTKGIIVVMGPNGFRSYLPPDMEDDLSSLQPGDRAQAMSIYLNPKPMSFPFDFQVDGVGKETQSFAGSLDFKFLPMSVMEEDKLLSFPVVTSIVLAGPSPANWDRASMVRFWSSLGTDLDRQLGISDLPTFADVLADNMPVDVKALELVPPGDVPIYKDWLETSARLEAIYLREPHKHAPMKRSQPLLTPTSNLSSERDAEHPETDNHGLVRIDIPGTITSEGQNRIMVNGDPLEIGDAQLQLLLRLMTALKKDSPGWVYLHQLTDEGVITEDGKYQAIGRLRDRLRRVLPEMIVLKLIERGGAGRYRIGTAMCFIEYNKPALAEHPDLGVRKQTRRLPGSRTRKK